MRVPLPLVDCETFFDIELHKYFFCSFCFGMKISRNREGKNAGKIRGKASRQAKRKERLSPRCVNVLPTRVGDPLFRLTQPIVLHMNPTHTQTIRFLSKSLEKQGKAIHFCIKPLS